MADHGALAPWRLIELRGAARERLGAAFVAASGLDGSGLVGSELEGSGLEDSAAQKLAEKPLRASLLIAVVALHEPSLTVPEWEQDAAASGVAHTLSLLLNEAGWGVMWRTGGHTRHPAVAAMHGLAPNEKLMGWLYVGGIPKRTKRTRKAKLDLEKHLTQLK